MNFKQFYASQPATLTVLIPPSLSPLPGCNVTRNVYQNPTQPLSPGQAGQNRHFTTWLGAELRWTQAGLSFSAPAPSLYLRQPPVLAAAGQTKHNPA